MMTSPSPLKLLTLALCLSIGILWGSAAQARSPAPGDLATAGRLWQPAGLDTCEDDCDDLANAVYEACLAEGRRQADCQQESDQILVVCITQRCSANVPPVSCDDDCAKRGEEIKTLCLDEGRPAAECDDLASRFADLCLKELCEVTLTPVVTESPRATDEPTDEPTATDEAKPTDEPTATDEAKPTDEPTDEPTATDEPAPTDEPTATDEPGGEPTAEEPTPTEESKSTPDTCEARCQARGLAFYNQCLASGGEPDKCAAGAEQVVTACLKESCQPPANQPPRLSTQASCEAQCTVRGRDFYNQCIAGGGTVEKCQIAAEKLVADCRVKDCNLPAATGTKEAAEPTSGAPTVCQRDCANRGAAYYRQCLADGGSEGECRAKTQRIIEECTRKSCAGLPGDRTATPGTGKEDPGASDDSSSCRLDCQRRAQAIYNRCIVTGNTDVVCRAQADAVQADCLATNCRISTTRECQRRCNVLGQTTLSQCMRTTGDLRACAEKARVAVQRCLDSCNGVAATSTPRSTKP
jgi:hypothetical protein